MTPDMRPHPVPEAVSQPYWDGLASHEIAIQRCLRCGISQHPPSPVCRHCGSERPKFSFDPVGGSGRLLSWTIMRDSFLPGFDDALPLVIGLVELDELPDVRLVARLIDGPEADYRLNCHVEPVFEDRDGYTLVNFRVSSDG